MWTYERPGRVTAHGTSPATMKGFDLRRAYAVTVFCIEIKSANFVSKVNA